MKNRKRILAILVAVLTLLMQLPLSVFAADSNPEVESICFEKISFIEGTGGSFVREHGQEYYRYSYVPHFTMTLKSGETFQYTGGSFSYNGESYWPVYQDDQYRNHWGVGTHTVPFEFLGYTGSFEVEITESPAAALEVEGLSIIEGTNGYSRTAYNPETGNYDLQYYHYNYQLSFAVTLKDGTVLHSSGEQIFYNGQSYRIAYVDDQNEQSGWGVGVHTGTASLMGFTVPFTVEIVKSPVARVAFKKLSIIQGTNLITLGNGQPLYEYDPEFTVWFTDGTSLSSKRSITYNGKTYRATCSDDQYNTPWGLGTHVVTATLLGYTTTFEVEIIESPIAKIEIQPVSLEKGIDGYERNAYNSQTHRWDLTYFEYTYVNLLQGTITLRDGTAIQFVGREATYDGVDYVLNWNDDQSYDTPWDVGVHSVQVTLMGYTTTVDVEVVESPVAAVAIEKITLIEGFDRCVEKEYDPDTGEEVSFLRYVYENPSIPFSVTFKDGRKYLAKRDASGYCLSYKGKDYRLSCTDDQSAQNPWGVGTHTVTATIMGYTTTFEVEIIESPYRLLEILQVYPITENANCRETDGCIIYDEPEVLFRVTDKDGQSFIASSETEPYTSISHNQSAEPWTVGGNNRFTLHYRNLSADGTVEMQPGSGFEYIEQNGGLYITKYRVSGQRHIEIPAEINGKPVVGILSLREGYGWRNQTLTYVESVTIPDSVKTIGDGAFDGAYQLKTLNIGSGVNNLCMDMINHLENLNSISISADNPYFCDVDGVVYDKAMTTLVAYPLARGEEYTVPASVTNIDILNSPVYDFLHVTVADGSRMFVTVDGVTYNADMTKVIRCNVNRSGAYVMPESVTDIADSAFTGCSQLTSVKISEKVTHVVYGAFVDCSALEQVTLPSGLVSIDGWAFDGCTSLAEIVLPETLKTIGERAFTGTGLKRISVPDSVTEIGRGAFAICDALAEAKLSGSLTYIEENLFWGCENLSAVGIPEQVVSIGESAFQYCEALTSIRLPDSVTSMGNDVFWGCTKLETVEIGRGLTEIPSGAFCGCGLKSLCVPEWITRIGSSAFAGCEIH